MQESGEAMPPDTTRLGTPTRHGNPAPPCPGKPPHPTHTQTHPPTRGFPKDRVSRVRALPSEGPAGLARWAFSSSTRRPECRGAASPRVEWRGEGAW